jgi:hypothetical protein
VTPQRRAKLERMADAVESPNEAMAARRLLDMESPILRPIIERVEAWGAVHGPCPSCGHTNIRHVGWTCYGAPSLVAVEFEGRKRAWQMVSYCPCQMGAHADGWQHPPSAALLGDGSAA